MTLADLPPSIGVAYLWRCCEVLPGEQRTGLAVALLLALRGDAAVAATAWAAIGAGEPQPIAEPFVGELEPHGLYDRIAALSPGEAAGEMFAAILMAPAPVLFGVVDKLVRRAHAAGNTRLLFEALADPDATIAGMGQTATFAEIEAVLCPHGSPHSSEDDTAAGVSRAIDVQISCFGGN